MKFAKITGKLGKDPEIKYFDSGKVKTTFSIATNGYDAKKKEKRTNWFEVEVWDKQAEFVGEYFKKGHTITVQGDLVGDPYNDKVYWKIKNTDAGNDKATIFVSGILESVEQKSNSNDKKFQVLKFKDYDFLVYLQSEVEVHEGEYKAYTCSLDMVDYKPLVKVIRSDEEKPAKAKKSKKEEIPEEEISEDEIPF